jgi:histidinol-phosphate aminotransferase
VTPVLEHAARRLDGIARYRPGRDAVGEGGKLSSNELFLGPSPRVRTAIAAAADVAHRYPSSEPLRDAVAASVGIARERVVLTSGSDELCYLLASVVIAEGDGVVMSDPSYRMDEIVTRLAGGRVHAVPVRDGAHDLDAMAAAARDARLLWLPTPHNPTGVAVDRTGLERLLAAVPDTCLVVLDEAYRDFVDPDRRPDSLALLDRHPNLVVQRTLSKAHGLAGLRVGFGLAHPELVATLDTIRPPFNVNAAALAAATAALADTAWRDWAVALTRRERDRLEATLRELAIEHWPSQANFVTVRLGDDAPALGAELAAAGITVRDGADLGLPGWVRISIGAPPAMAIVRAALRTTRKGR